MQSVDDLTSGEANGYIVGQVFFDVFRVSSLWTAQRSAGHSLRVNASTCSIMYDADLALVSLLQERFGSGVGGILLMIIPMITTFNSTSLSLTTNARQSRPGQPCIGPGSPAVPSKP